jgi:hypothetical protein
MLKRFGLPTMVLGAVLAVVSPNAALAKHHKHVRHERVWSERPPIRGHIYIGPARPYGYYDRWGYWRPYGRGYYDAWGYYHPYW